MSNIQIGKKYKISDGSGIDSNKIVTVVPNIKIKLNSNGIPTNVEGAYSRPNWSKEVAIQYENGEYGIMFKNRLNSINENSMEYGLGKLIKENLETKTYYEDLTTLDRYFLHTCKNAEISNEWDDYLENLFKDDVTESGSHRKYLSELTRDEQYEAVLFGLKLKQKCESTITESLAGSDATTLTELENGNLLMTINDEGKEEIKDLQEKGLSENEILAEMLEGYLTNGYDNLTGLIGLTDSFIIGLNWDRNDEGDYIENEEAKAWWLPDYMVTDYIEKLLTEGQITFTLAQSN